MSGIKVVNASGSLTQRLLKDITDIVENPYPNVSIHINDIDVSKICLILTPQHSQPLHFTVKFGNKYPLQAPTITIQSTVQHPNVFGSYICASMLNTDEGWTSAYTLKAITIQLLSFFSSERLEQDYGGHIDLVGYRNESAGSSAYSAVQYVCGTCKFNRTLAPQKGATLSALSQQTRKRRNRRMRANESRVNERRANESRKSEEREYEVREKEFMVKKKGNNLPQLPDELWLLILSKMDTLDVVAFSDAIPLIKDKLHTFDFIRMRELQCFCLKKTFLETKLGVGVSVDYGRKGVFRSEFDLLSEEAFNLHGIRKSIQGVAFHHWLPIPLSPRHWNLVRLDVARSLDFLHQGASLRSAARVDVLYGFMNNIVVQFSTDAENSHHQPDARSTLTHASEKAVEAYFTLFHLLLCLAIEHPNIIASANRMVSRFLAGPRTKTHFPDLGHLLVASLISDSGLTEALIFHIIKEAVLRNVVWMLDRKGAGMAELAYLEPCTFSDYRLAKTFQASRTSYRLLMFMKLFSSTARTPGKTLIQLRDQLFASHGAPPPNVSAETAHKIRRIRSVNSFPAFLAEMGIKAPTKERFSTFLKRTVRESVDVGYSIMPITQAQAFLLRREKEEDVEWALEVKVTRRDEQWFYSWSEVPSFFPGGGKYVNGRGRGGGRGRGRGRGRGEWRGRA